MTIRHWSRAKKSRTLHQTAPHQTHTHTYRHTQEQKHTSPLSSGKLFCCLQCSLTYFLTPTQNTVLPLTDPGGRCPTRGGCWQTRAVLSGPRAFMETRTSLELMLVMHSIGTCSHIHNDHSLSMSLSCSLFLSFPFLSFCLSILSISSAESWNHRQIRHQKKVSVAQLALILSFSQP